uniref:Uncharacterized protein n=1 Tax=Anguilla anguilla TaxID=7936 RepID=A0A0E9WCE3_ANGAN
MFVYQSGWQWSTFKNWTLLSCTKLTHILSTVQPRDPLKS